MKSLFSHKKFWAHRFGIAPFLPMSREEMDDLGWDSCDVILVTGDAYVDHPSFGMALVGRLLEAHGFRVGIITQPDWQSADAFQVLGKPNLFFGVTAGNMDSMVNRYTADNRLRHDDAYSPNGEGGKRPDRSTLVYSQRCREAYKDVPIILGGIEASLRRIAHYDYWSDKVRRSVLVDAKADVLLFGNAERALVEVAHRLAKKEPIQNIRDLRGTAFLLNQEELDQQLTGKTQIDLSHLPDNAQSSAKLSRKSYDLNQHQSSETNTAKLIRFSRANEVIQLPSYEQVKRDAYLYAHTSRQFHLETNPGNARPLIQPHDHRFVWINPPPIPLETEELDRIYELPYARIPHPAYAGKKIPAYEMIRFSVNIMRGCFGGCTFCSITEHEGRIIQNRSEDSILRELEEIRDRTPGFTGQISDLGGPTANMYRLKCKSEKVESACRKLSCVYPDICKNLNTDHDPLIHLYRAARKLPGIKKIGIASGLRYDLAVRSPKYIEELATHHVGGYLKIAPEHTEENPLSQMMKPGIDSFYRFREQFNRASKKAGKEQYLIPYFIAAHPGTTDQDMAHLARWLKQNKFRPDQVQNFLPTPSALATAMYHSGLSPLKKITRTSKTIPIPRGGRRRRIHKAFLRYHDPKNWSLLRQALQEIGLENWIGSGKQALIPTEPAFRKPNNSLKNKKSSRKKPNHSNRSNDSHHSDFLSKTDRNSKQKLQKNAGKNFRKKSKNADQKHKK